MKISRLVIESIRVGVDSADQAVVALDDTGDSGYTLYHGALLEVERLSSRLLDVTRFAGLRQEEDEAVRHALEAFDALTVRQQQAAAT